MALPSLLASLLPGLLGGCLTNNPYLSDDEGKPSSNPGLFSFHDDQLSTPYALGTHVKVTGHFAEEGWRVESDTPSVMTCTKTGVTTGDAVQVTADCVALAEGTAHVSLLDGSSAIVRKVDVTVRAAETAKIFSHGPLRLLGPDPKSADTAVVTEARVATGGTAVFAVAYFAGGERVFGHGIAELPTLSGVTLTNKTSADGPSNEWIILTPSMDGEYAVTLSQHGKQLGALAVTAVPASDATSLVLAKEVGDKSDDDRVWVLAEGRDANGRAVLGIYPDWSLDGVSLAQEAPGKKQGDLLGYKQGGKVRTVVASSGAVKATIEVPAKSAFIEDTTYLGCSAAPGSATPRNALPLVLVGLLAWLAVRLGRRTTITTA